MYVRSVWMVLGVLILSMIGSACDTVKPQEEESQELLLHIESVDYPLEVPVGASVDMGLVFVVECPVHIRKEKEALEENRYRLAVYGELVFAGCEPAPGFAEGRSETFFRLGEVVDTTYYVDILSPEAIYTVSFRPVSVQQPGRYHIRTNTPFEEEPVRVQAVLYERTDQSALPLDTLTLDAIGQGLFERTFDPPVTLSLDNTLFFELIFTYPDRPAFHDIPRPLTPDRYAVRVKYLGTVQQN